MRWRFMFVTLILLCYDNRPLCSQTWVAKANMITARHHAMVAVVGDLIYVIGGGTPTLIVNSNEVYNTTTNTWTTLAPMPTARGEGGAAVVNGKVYVIGGWNGSTLNTVEEYNPITNTWATKAAMPTARGGFSVTVVNNIIYAIGGIVAGVTELSTVEAYDPATNTWSTKAPLAVAKGQINGAEGFSSGRLYFIGGKNRWITSIYNNNSRYEVNANSWTEMTPCPISFYYGATCANSSMGKIHVLGGTDAPYGSLAATFNSHYIYDLASDQWVAGSALPQKRALHVAACVNNKIFVIGGKDEVSATVNTVYELSNYALPVTWGAFTGRADDGKILLCWETLQESNTSDFIIEHSRVGTNWNPVGKVNAATNSATPMKYFFTHFNPAVGPNYYRIVQRDISGRTTLGKIINVPFENKWRTPFTVTSFATGGSFSLYIHQSSQIVLYNNVGQLLWRKYFSEGAYTITSADLPSGIYYLRSGHTTRAVFLK